MNRWWRRGESNSGPYYIIPQALQAYSVVRFWNPAVNGQTLRFLAGSIFIEAIPATCFDAVP